MRWLIAYVLWQTFELDHTLKKLLHWINYALNVSNDRNNKQIQNIFLKNKKNKKINQNIILNNIISVSELNPSSKNRKQYNTAKYNKVVTQL